jgi:hypothetical protein
VINYLKTAKALGLDVPATFPCLPTGAPCAPSGDQWLHEMGPVVFEHACRMGLEGIVSKRKASWYQSGRSRDWVKAKNPKAPAVTRLAEEDWGRSWSSSGSGRPSPRSR